jgi:periplasmic protein TonB
VYPQCRPHYTPLLLLNPADPVITELALDLLTNSSEVTAMLGSPKRSALLSALIHALAIILILIVAASKHSVLTELIPVRETPVYLPLRVRLQGLSGGGGQRSPLPPSKGHPPKAAPRVFTPPIMRVQETHPLIEMPPTVLAAVDTRIPNLNLPIGSLTGVNGPASGGPGSTGGIGNGSHGGNGDKDGPGGGDGPGGDGFSGLHGRNVTQPVLLSRKDPEYSDEARKVKLQGTVILGIEVNAAGQVTNVVVLRSLGLGLDERAIEAVRQWKFRAGTMDGKPVSTRATVEVNFRLL